MQTLREFRTKVPLVDEVEIERVLSQLVASPSRRRVRRFVNRRRLTLAIAIAALALAAGAVAAIKEVPWWQSGAPAVDPQAVVSVALDNMPANVRVADARTVATDGDAALVAVPLDTTGYCLIPTLDAHSFSGASCIYQVVHPEQDDGAATATASRAESAGSPARWIAYGRITDPRAATLDLGAFRVRLGSGGFFLAQVPVDVWQKLSGTANPGAILDSSGRLLRRGCVNWGSSPGSAGSATYDSTLFFDQAGGDCKPQIVPPAPTLDLSRAKTLFTVTLTQPFSIWDTGQQITFEAVPASDGTTCPVLVGPGLPASANPHCGGPSIESQGNGEPINVEIGSDLHHADGKAFYTFSITGTTNPSTKITRLTLASPTTTAQVSYRDNFFFVQLPATTPGPRIGNVPFPDGQWVLSGYDASGREVVHIDLGEHYRQLQPH